MTLPSDAGGRLLPVARAAIETRLAGTTTSQIPVGDLAAREPRPSWLLAPGASFVSVREQGALRGCIGTLTAHRALVEDVAHNAIAAAVHDPRFPPLSEAELAEVLLEVSVLSGRVPLPHASEESVLSALVPGRDGVVLESGPQIRATFLPQVWEELSDPAEFLTHLKLKAGLSADWWDDDVRIETYTVESWAEPGY